MNVIPINGTLKKCGKCKQFKPLAEFAKDSHRKDGFNGKCKVCYNEYKRTYNSTHKDKEALYHKRSYAKHRDKRIAYNTNYNKTHKDRVAVHSRNSRIRKKIAQQKSGT